MPLLFSYGSLRHPDVQQATFGRSLDGLPDQLVAFVLVPAVAGVSAHANVIPGTDTNGRVPGMAFEVSNAELASADLYERRDGYVRVAAALASGRKTWVYVDARTAPG